MPINKSNSFSNSKVIKHIKYDNDKETYVVEFKDKLIDDRGWFKYEGETNTLETIDFYTTVKNLIVDIKDSLFKCILNYYKMVAFEVKKELVKNLKKENLFVVKRLRLEQCLDSFLYPDMAFGNTDNQEFYLKNGFTALKLEMEFYKNNYDKEFPSDKFLEPFSLLIERLGINNEMIEGIKNYPLFTKVPKDLDSVNLCYNLIKGEFRIRTYYPDTLEWRGIVGFSDEVFMPLGFVSMSYLWDDFRKGNRQYVSFVESYLQSISWLARPLSYKDKTVLPLAYLNKKVNPISVGVGSKDAERLNRIRYSFENLESAFYSRGEVRIDSHEMLVDNIDALFKNNEFVQKSINNPNLNDDLTKLLRSFKLD